MLVATYDEEAGPQLHAIEPSGVCYVRTKTARTRGRAQRAASAALSTNQSRAESPHSTSCLVSVSVLPQRYFATAIGKYKQGSSSELEKLDFTKLTCAEAVKHVARIIYKLHDEVKDKELEIEISWVCDASKRSDHTTTKRKRHRESHTTQQRSRLRCSPGLTRACFVRLSAFGSRCCVLCCAFPAAVCTC